MHLQYILALYFPAISSRSELGNAADSSPHRMHTLKEPQELGLNTAIMPPKDSPIRKHPLHQLHIQNHCPI